MATKSESAPHSPDLDFVNVLDDASPAIDFAERALGKKGQERSLLFLKLHKWAQSALLQTLLKAADSSEFGHISPNTTWQWHQGNSERGITLTQELPNHRNLIRFCFQTDNPNIITTISIHKTTGTLKHSSVHTMDMDTTGQIPVLRMESFRRKIGTSQTRR